MNSSWAESAQRCIRKAANCGTIEAWISPLERPRREQMLDDITNIAIEDYLIGLMPPRPAVLAELERRAHDRGLPLVGPVEGQLLYLLAKSMGAREALEIGTATGYAAMWLMYAVVP